MVVSDGLLSTSPCPLIAGPYTGSLFLYPLTGLLSGSLELTVDFLKEIDKLVQLIESPIFACKYRIALIGGACYWVLVNFVFEARVLLDLVSPGKFFNL